MSENFIFYGQQYEIITLVFSCIGATLFILLALLALFVFFRIMFISDDKEMDFLKSLSDDEKLLITKYKLAKRVHTKEIFSKKKNN